MASVPAMKIIAVHGATGAQGRPLVDQFLTAGHQVRALARNPRDLPSGAHPVAADLSDADSLTEAYRGADTVVVQFPVLFSEEVLNQAANILKAVSRNEIQHVILNTSGGLPNTRTGIPFLDARAQLRAELPNLVPTVSVISPAGLFYEVLADPWSIEGNEFRHPLPAELPLSWVAAADVATATVDLLTDPVPVQLISGPEDLTGAEVGAALSEAMGREIHWNAVAVKKYESLMAPHLGAEVAAGVTSAYETMAEVEFESAPVRYGRTTLREWLKQQPWSA